MINKLNEQPAVLVLRSYNITSPAYLFYWQPVPEPASVAQRARAVGAAVL